MDAHLGVWSPLLVVCSCERVTGAEASQVPLATSAPFRRLREWPCLWDRPQNHLVFLAIACAQCK